MGETVDCRHHNKRVEDWFGLLTMTVMWCLDCRTRVAILKLEMDPKYSRPMRHIPRCARRYARTEYVTPFYQRKGERHVTGGNT